MREQRHPLPCVFHGALLARHAVCELVQRSSLAERETLACPSAPAHLNCETLESLFLERAIFPLKLHPGVPLTHATVMRDLRPVGRYPRGASPYGALDMAGNGWEWVSSAYRPYPYDAADGREDPDRYVARGTRGGGPDARAAELTTTHRGRHVSRAPRSGHHNIAFRCAR